MQVVSSGGPFVVEDVEREQARFDAREIVLTGPMVGRKMKQPTDGSLKRELASLEKFELQVSDFDRYPKLTSGTRRPLIIWPPDLRVAMTDAGVRFDFTLPTGAYATSLLREFQKNDGGTEL
jgi:tRNA pseudouridine13 synthase